jgi:branched-chain amino acid transport system substrate-binding protein
MLTGPRRTAAGCAALLLTLAACGSHARSGAGSTTAPAPPNSAGPAKASEAATTAVAPATTAAAGSATGGPATGKPVKIGFVNLEGGAVSLPELRIGAETAAAYLNTHGGVHGRPIQIVPCNVDGTPEKSIDCANRLVSDGATVVMEGYDPGSDAMLPVLKSANVPLVGHAAFGPQQEVADDAFFFGAANPSYAAGFLDYYAHSGAKSMMLFLPDNPSGRGFAQSVAEPLAGHLGLNLHVTFYNAASPDWASLATSALAAKTDVAGTIAPEGDCVGLLHALRSIKFGGSVFLGTCSAFMAADPAGAVGVATTSDLWKPTDLTAPPPDKQAQVQQYINIMTAAGQDKLINGFAYDYFSDTWDLAAALGRINGDVTPAAATDALRSTKDLDSFMGPTVTCDHTAWPGRSACGNKVLLYQVQSGGTQKALTGQFIDTSKYIPLLGS